LINAVYVNGDSFTEGCEISHHLSSIHEGYYSLNDFIKQSPDQLQKKQYDYIKKWNEFSIKDPTIQHRMKFEKENRWSTYLSKLIDRPVLNMSSQGGSSLYAISFRTMQDLQYLKKNNFNITDVVIQLTGTNRYSVFSHTEKGQEPNDHKIPYNLISFNQNYTEKNLSKLYDMLIEHEWDFANHRYLFDLFLLENTIKSITSARIIFVDSVFFTNSALLSSPWTDIEFDNLHFLNDYVKKIKSELELSMISCITADEPDTLTGGLHFTAPVHKKFAQKIAKRYFNGKK
jgi:hypothetical protein